tara:strand:- start:1347 stop:1787 length:441 start_codon:yes stop_codon:yes gene_type:complete
MKMTKNELADLVTEELVRMVENGELDEGFLDRLKARGAGVGSKLKGAARGAVQKGLGGIASAAGEDEMAAKMRDKAGETKAAAAKAAGGKQAASLLKGKARKAKAMADDLKNDIAKLGVDVPQLNTAVEALERAAEAVEAALGRIG